MGGRESRNSLHENIEHPTSNVECRTPATRIHSRSEVQYSTFDVFRSMIFKSIKWRLQLWYGLILVAVLVGFGVTAFQLERGRQFRRIDGELQRRVNALASALRQPPRGRGPGEGQFDGQPPEQFRPWRQCF